jgi:multiple sugar transport system permease protein
MNLRRGLFPYLLILPSLALIALIFAYPVVDLVRTSLADVNRFGQIRGFAGLANYEFLFGDPVFIGSLWRTLVWTVGVVGGTILLSVPISLILSEDFYGRNVARTVILLPWAISLTMTAIVWRWALNGQYGMLNASLDGLGLLDRPVEWLATATTAFPFEIGIGILVSIPFTVSILLGGLASISPNLFEAAQIDGASPLGQFRHITSPLLRPFLGLATLLNVIYVFNSFPIIWVLTKGGPANGTDILVTYLYKLAFEFGDLGSAAAMSLVMFAILLAFSLAYARSAFAEARA